jgi:hypothetical protein
VNLPNDLLEKLQEYAYSGALGAFAAVVGYLFQIARGQGQRISFLVLIATIVIGFYMGVLFGNLIPRDWGNRDAVLLLIGATGLKGFEIVSNWAKTALPNLLRTLVNGSGNSGQNPPPPPTNGEGNGGQ